MSRYRGQNIKKYIQGRLYVDLSEKSPHLIQNNDGKHAQRIRKWIKYFIKQPWYSFEKLLIHLTTLSEYQGDEASFTQYDERKYLILQSHQFRNETDYDTIKHIRNNITILVSHLNIILIPFYIFMKLIMPCFREQQKTIAIWPRQVMVCIHQLDPMRVFYIPK